jgi:hypothetical protein
VELRADAADGRTVCDVAFDSRAAAPRVLLDLPSVLQALRHRAVETSSEDGGRKIVLKTEHALVSVHLSPAGQALPLDGITLLNAGGGSIAIGMLGLDTKGSVRTSGVDGRAIERPGVQVQAIDADTQISPTVPPDFGTVREKREAAARLSALFLKRQ